MDYLRGIFKWQIRSTDSPRYFAFGLSVSLHLVPLAFSWIRVAQSCWCQWHSVIGRLPAGARVAERARDSFTVCLEARASVSERVHARLPSQSVDSWKAVELRDTANFRFLCVFYFDVLRANSWNVLFVNARGGHSPLHLFISSFNLNSIVLYLKHLWQYVS